jgi:hypothetical protein
MCKVVLKAIKRPVLDTRCRVRFLDISVQFGSVVNYRLKYLPAAVGIQNNCTVPTSRSTLHLKKFHFVRVRMSIEIPHEIWPRDQTLKIGRLVTNFN